ncbi:hypothetical protein [Dawidia soli]|uniref:Uncharacterized protein n=1 Tax=Dawidia soli TaxID=2782352 RepID=A0AAP2GK45_9BACT|nr:hypothetical protein [Dawidia soli]MBT1689225.1 hypothetical protein [Dawidia soli]
MDVNFVTHSRGAFEVFATDDRFTPHHISLYMALFAVWNLTRWEPHMRIAREEIMLRARFGSVNTYYRCLQDLHAWGYIVWKRAARAHRPSTVAVKRLDQGLHDVTHVLISETGDETEVGPSIVNPSKPRKRPNRTGAKQQTPSPAPTGDAMDDFFSDTRGGENAGAPRGPAGARPADLKEAVDFFHAQKSTAREAEKFHSYYQANGWRQGGRAPMEDWQAAARSWILKVDYFEATGAGGKTGPKPNHLDTDDDKDYDKPL